RESNHLAFALPDGETFGPVDTVVEKLLELDLLKCRHCENYEKEAVFRNFYDNFYNDLTFVLIKPLAFRNQCVGRLLSVIENNSCCIR
ncbi:hypothetical protein MKW94_019635, partial [Papaver nudicaule]|nr:hypothetical protein [Papaver nudicaule]